MGKVVYWMTVSLDGFVSSRDGSIDWTMPDEELFIFHTDSARKLGAFLHGRRTYQEMANFWDHVGLDRSVPDRVGGLGPELVAEFARVWRAKPKVVFSRTLSSAPGPTRRARGARCSSAERLTSARVSAPPPPTRVPPPP